MMIVDSTPLFPQIWPVPAEHLRKTSVPVMSDSDCNATYLDYDAKYNLPNVVLDSMICLQVGTSYYNRKSNDSFKKKTANLKAIILLRSAL